MRTVRDDRFGSIRQVEMIWPEASVETRPSENILLDGENEKKKKNIFTLARAIVDKGYSRRRLRRASSIF